MLRLRRSGKPACAMPQVSSFFSCCWPWDPRSAGILPAGRGQPSCFMSAPVTMCQPMRDTRFRNRHEAGELVGRELARRLGPRDDLIVLALPRGGVPVGYEVAKAL